MLVVVVSCDVGLVFSDHFSRQKVSGWQEMVDARPPSLLVVQGARAGVVEARASTVGWTRSRSERMHYWAG